MGGDVGVGGVVAELLGEGAGGLADLQDEFLGGAFDVDLPALVAEVAFDFAGDAGLGVGGEAAAEVGVEVVDGLDQAEVADLEEVFGGFGAVFVPGGAGADQVAVAGDQQLARGGAAGGAQRLGAGDAQQGAVVEAAQVGEGAPGGGQRGGRAGGRGGRSGGLLGYFLQGKCFHEERLSWRGVAGKPRVTKR